MKNEIKNIPVTGVCCSCQSTHSVYHDGKRVLMQRHFFMGSNEYCEGMNTVPQVVFNKDGQHIRNYDLGHE